MAEAATLESFAPMEDMGPDTLSQQPPSLPSIFETPNEDWDQLFSHLESRMGMMRSVRYSWWAYWAQLAEYLLPRRYIWLVTANLFRRGSPINQSIIDSTATLAMNICAAGMVDGLFPNTRRWFKHGVAMPGITLDADAKKWLEDLDEAVETVLGQSNFYNIMAQSCQDLTTFGTAPVICYEDKEDVVRFYAPCCGEYYLSCGSRLSVDTLYREFTLTVAQVVEMFTLEACPPQVREMWETGGASLEMEYVVAHAIEPNFALSARGKKKGKITVLPGSFVYREIYWLRGVKTPAPLSKRGFNDKPFAVARWSTVSNDPYGRGPGMDALGDVKQLQLETRRKAEGIEKQVRPPMGADPELKNEPSSINPGQITYVNTAGAKKGFWPLYEVKPDLTAMSADLKDISARIERCFLVDVFNIISQMEGVQPRNELEIAERKGEKLQRLGPVIGLIKTEFAAPIIQRVVGIMQRRRMLKPMPASLRGIPLKTEYIDMVTLAQLGSETVSMEQTFKVAGGLSSAAKAAGVADPLRVFNLDESMRLYAERLTFPQKGLYTEDEVKQHDAMREKMANQNKLMAATQPAVDAAHTLSQTDVGGGQSALQAILGSKGGPSAPGA